MQHGRSFLRFQKLFRAKRMSAFLGLLLEVSCVVVEGKVVFRQIRKSLARSFFPSGVRSLCRNRRAESTNSTETTTRLQTSLSQTKFPAHLGRHDSTPATRHSQHCCAQLQSSEERRATQDIGQQTNVTDDIVAEPAAKQQRTIPPRLPSTLTSSSRPLLDSPMAT